MATTDPPGAPGASNAVDAPEEAAARRPAWFTRARRVVLELGLFVGLFFALTSFQERHLLPSHTAAPPFELATLSGDSVSLESLHGKRVALHFWATWCGVCRREQGALNAVASDLGKDEAVYAIVADSDDPDRIRRFVAEEHIRYPVLLATPEVLAAFHVGAFPTTYYVNRDGTIGGHSVGMSTRYAIRARLGLLD